MTNVWTQLFPADSPGELRFFTMVYDPVRDNVVLFGGETEGSSTPVANTWIWDGTNWTQVFPADSPPGRIFAAMAWHPGSETVVLYGGNHDDPGGSYLFDTWTWDGTDWTEQSPAHHPGSGTYLPGAAATDFTNDKVVLIGDPSTGLGHPAETWTWDGTDWTQESPADSPTAPGFPQNCGGMSWDDANDNVVLFSPDENGETWTWDGTNWTQQTPADSPAGLSLTGMAYVPLIGAVILFGGIDTGSCVGDTWSWDGTNWTELSVGSPGNRGTPLVANPTNALLYGGYICTGTGGSDTWELAPGDVPPPGAIPFLHSHHSTV